MPVITLAEFPDAAAAADYVKTVMLAYPRTSAAVIREAGILSWGLMANAQVMPCSASCGNDPCCVRYPPTHNYWKILRKVCRGDLL
jgi:hypothetical protein